MVFDELKENYFFNPFIFTKDFSKPLIKSIQN